MTSLTFSQLLNRFGRVEIPTIQRDYVQGRNEQSVVRDGFLSVLYDALSGTDEHHALDLDFVYGSVSSELVSNGSGRSAFQPLDGQQRLTTLFLLHWYLAWRDHAEDDFRERFAVGGKSRFGYEVRPSSRDFIDALATHFPEYQAADRALLSEVIKDEAWFFRGWKFDPTIQSALDMLDTMHKRFGNASGLYARLIDDTKPAITFQLLELEKFGLSDDLYIKMNARGKPLTAFETFKARFEDDLKHLFDDAPMPQLCGDQPVAKFFAHRIDTAWSDFFWPFRDIHTATFDDAIMNLLRAVIIVTRSPEAKTTDRDLTDLRRSMNGSSYDWFHQRTWLDQDMVTAFMTLLEHWCSDAEHPFRLDIGDERHLAEDALFRSAITRPSDLTYLQYLQFAAYTQFLVHASGEGLLDGFGSWMRVITNLAENTEYAGSDDLRRSFTGLHSLIPYMNDILGHLAANGTAAAPGFNVAQFNEERIKAHLIGLSEGWAERIARAERHDYFRGQIGFLLRFSGIDLNNADEEIARLGLDQAQELIAAFDHYFTCSVAMMNALTSDPAGVGRLWERALLATGDFLPMVGSNYCLLVTARDEAGSWKRLLGDAGKGEEHALVLQELWDQLTDPECFEAELVRVIDEQDDIELWRSAIISTPSVYSYGSKKMLRFVYDECEAEDDETFSVYLLSKSQMNGRHVELFTFCLYKKMSSDHRDLSFEYEYEETISTDDNPCLHITHTWDKDSGITFSIHFESETDQFEIWFDRSDVEVFPEVDATLVDRGFEIQDGDDDGWSKKCVGHSDIIKELQSLDDLLGIKK